MRSGTKLWSTIVDYFLILSAVIGVGFASGKEIYVFFFDFDAGSLIGLLSFGILYIYLFFIIDYIRKKCELKSYSEFNNEIFGKLCKISEIVMLINFAITSAGMLAGADYLFQTFLGIGYKIPSIILSVITFFILLGGINKIKFVANLIIPIMIAVIVVNSIKNINPENVNMAITAKNGAMAIYYGLLFGVNNFVAALPVLFETNLKSKGKIAVILSICLIILLNILVFASNNFVTDMPMFELSKQVSKSFYYIYFATLLLGLFSTLMICSHNSKRIIAKDKKTIFVPLMIVLFNLILSNLGYAFIVKYLYVLSGIFSGIYVVSLIILIAIKLIKFNRQKNKNNEISSKSNEECCNSKENIDDKNSK